MKLSEFNNVEIVSAILSTKCLYYRQLTSIGTLQEKVHVRASQDAYARFGQKMSDVKKENEKRTTQLLDRGPKTQAKRLIPPAMFNANSGSNSRSAIPVPSNSINATSIPKTGGSPRRSNGSSTSSYLPGNHPMLERHRGPDSATRTKKVNYNPDLLRRPLRERIIHLLAVRPFKKPELLARISRGNIFMMAFQK